MLPYDLIVKDVFPENVKIVTDFSKQTGDYSSLSATDIKVMALTYQLEKELVGVSHINTEPRVKMIVNFDKTPKQPREVKADIAGFYLPEKKIDESSIDRTEDEKMYDQYEDDNKCNIQYVQIDLTHTDEVLIEKFANVELQNQAVISEEVENVLAKVSEDSADENEEVDDDGWITPSNIKSVKKQINSACTEEKNVKVACITTDFAMQNVLKQMNLQISALDGRVIKEVRTFILRCYTCFGLTSVMTKKFCPKCGNDTLKKVAVSVDENGKQQIHINARKPLTSRGKKYSLPTFKGGKHSNNPQLAEDQPQPDQKPTRLARTKNNPMDTDYIAGYSPFVMRDVNSKSAQLCIRPGQEVKHWMRKNPNESRRKKK